MKRWLIAMMIVAFGFSGNVYATDFPQATISNGEIQAQFYLPDAKDGYYLGTRFDWSAVVYSLRYRDHEYYGPWFQKMDPAVHDFIYEGEDIIAGRCSAISGPVEEFQPLWFDEAKPGETFLKIGVGVLRRPDTSAYDHYKTYEIVDPGKWSVRSGADWITFIQELSSAEGFSYLYTKTVRLVEGKPEMLIEHRLKNTGRRAIATSVYDHNFLVLDHRPPGTGLTVTLPFPIEGNKPLPEKLAAVRGNQVVYLKDLEGKDVVSTPLQGFGADAKDYDIRLENTQAGAGMRIRANRPMTKMGLWSIRSVVAAEPYLGISVEPKNEFTWDFTYDFFTLPTVKPKN
jgi:hypothetical protein